MTDAIHPHVAALLPGSGPFHLDPLAGDASNRRYYRVTQGDAPFILMQLADAEGFKKSEEAVTGEVPVEELPFLNMQRYLAKAGLPVPEVIGQDMEHGLILLEDFGDRSLMAAIEGRPEEDIMALYWEAIDHLAAMQRDTKLDDGCVATHRVYGEELLLWEFQHYVEYGIEARYRQPVDAARRKVLDEYFGRIAAEIAAQPQVLVHRDYHSRNLMVKPDGHLGIIDFQDALLGPATYDLASLLWDPYVTLPEEVPSDLTARYWAQAPAKLDMSFPRALNLTAFQRLLKAAGRFVYIDRVKGNPAFLKDVPTCLARARWILSRYDDLKPLAKALAALDPEMEPE
ncbi:MAG: phosphotransferase [Nitrospirota bacterium]|nr:phosphotransferase [Nitrospirota bacterium]